MEKEHRKVCVAKDFLHPSHLFTASIDRTMSGDDAWIEYMQLPMPRKRTNQQCK